MKRIPRGRPLPPEEASQYKAVQTQVVRDMLDWLAHPNERMADAERETDEMFAEETTGSRVDSRRS
jgi:hypothetical protein